MQTLTLTIHIYISTVSTPTRLIIHQHGALENRISKSNNYKSSISRAFSINSSLACTLFDCYANMFSVSSVRVWTCAVCWIRVPGVSCARVAPAAHTTITPTYTTAAGGELIDQQLYWGQQQPALQIVFTIKHLVHSPYPCTIYKKNHNILPLCFPHWYYGL